MRSSILCIFAFIVTTAAAQFHADARWITAPEGADMENQWFAFRRIFDLGDVRTEAVLAKMAVDSKYWLWINDSLVVFEGGLRRGPTPLDTYYDEVEIGPFLRQGENTIAVLVWFWGRDGFNHKNSGKAGLLFEAQVGGQTWVSDRNWKVKRHPAFGNTGPPHPNYRLPEFNIHFDARRDISGWQGEDFRDDAWAQATEVCAPPCPPWNELWPRPIPLWYDSGRQPYFSVQLQGSDSATVLRARLPRNLTITPYLGMVAPAGLTIDMRTDNYKGGSEYNLRTEYVTKAGEQTFETFGYLNGHEVIYTLPPGVEVLDLGYRETRYDTEYIGYFHCDDPALNTLWEKARNTLNINLRDAIQDPDRERAQWWGDAVIIMGEIFYACDHRAIPLIRKAMGNLVEWQKPNGVLYSPVPSGNWGKELPGQMLASIGESGFWNYFRYTADTSTIRFLYPHVREYLSLWERGPDGLVVERPGGWTWLDWGDKIDTTLIYNTWYYQALSAASKMSELCADSIQAVQYRQQMSRLHRSFNDLCWTPDGYRSPGHAGPVDDRGNGLAIVTGLADSARWPVVKQVLETTFHASPYTEKYLLEACLMMDDTDLALWRMKKRYGKMIEHPVTTLWEGWGIGKEGYGGGSYNHGWAGGPLTLLSQYVAGIAPLEAGYGRYRLRPQPGPLRSVSCAAPTPKGVINMEWEKREEKSVLRASVPQGMSGELHLPVLDRAPTRLYFNRELIWSDGSMRVRRADIAYLGEEGGFLKFAIRNVNHFHVVAE